MGEYISLEKLYRQISQVQYNLTIFYNIKGRTLLSVIIYSGSEYDSIRNVYICISKATNLLPYRKHFIIILFKYNINFTNWQ